MFLPFIHTKLFPVICNKGNKQVDGQVRKHGKRGRRRTRFGKRKETMVVVVIIVSAVVVVILVAAVMVVIVVAEKGKGK